jgi:hypothetical protein
VLIAVVGDQCWTCQVYTLRQNSHHDRWRGRRKTRAPSTAAIAASSVRAG